MEMRVLCRLFALSVVSCSALQVAAQLQAGSPWPMYRHDAQHTARADAGALLGAPAAWSIQTGPGATQPAVGAGGVMYLGDADGVLWALNADATVRWTLALGSVVGTPVIDADGVIYVGCCEGMNAVSPEGVLLWRYQTEGHVTPAAIGADGTLYFGSSDYCFYAVLPNGELRWRFEADNVFVSAPAIGPDGTVYAPDWNGYLYAFAPDGGIRWQACTTGYPMHAPAVSPDGIVCVSTPDGNLYAFGPDGTLRWSVLLGGELCDPAIGDDGVIYVGATGTHSERMFSAIGPDGSVKWRVPLDVSWAYVPALGSGGVIYAYGRALDAADGHTLWFSDAVQSAPVLTADGSVLCTSCGWSPSAHVLWESGDELGKLAGPVTGADGTLYVGSDLRRLYALHPDGTVKWYVELEGGWGTPSVAPDGTIYVHTGSFLYAITETGEVRWALPMTGYTLPLAFGPDGTLYVVQDNHITALRPDGLGKWQYKAEAKVLSRPGVGRDGTLYFTTDIYNHLNALSSKGELLWQYMLWSAGGSEPAVGEDGTVYVAALAGGILAVSPNGELRWSYDIGGYANEDPVIGADGTVYIGHGKCVFAFEPGGALLWEAPTLNSGYQSIRIGQDGTLYACAEDVVAITASGEVRALSPVSADWPGAVLPDNSVVVVEDWRLVCLSLWTRKATGALEFGHLTGAPPVTAPFELRTPGEVSAFGLQSVGIAGGGEFTVRIPPSLLELSVKPSHWLRRTLHGVDATGGDVEGLFLAVTNGDVNGDNWVDLADVALVLATLGTPGGPADLNHDGVVGVADLCIALTNFGLTGEQ
jgi:outer membrane protein assembly factor BamB